MNKILLALLFFASSAFAGDRVIINPEQDGDIKIKVNDGGVVTDVMLFDGATSVMSVKSGTISEIVVDSGNGGGSTDDRIRRYTTEVVNTGTAITRASTAGNGDTFTINQNGIYTITVSDLMVTGTGGNRTIGISRNSTQLSGAGGDIQSITSTHRLASMIMLDTGNTTGFFTSWTGFLASGDVIRGHYGGGTAAGFLGADTQTRFQIRLLLPTF